MSNLASCGTAFGEEVLQDGGAFVGMRDLRVKLDAPAPVGPFQSDGDGVFIGGDDFRCAGEVRAGVAVAHPDLGFVRDAAEEVFVVGDDELGGPYSRVTPGFTVPPCLMLRSCMP
jgi:hypothetical protein